MTVIEKYVCDFCGKEFDDDGECYAHEIQEQFDSICQSVIFFGRHFNKISIKDILEGYACDAFQVSKEEEIPLIKKLFEESSICSPWEKEGGDLPGKTGLYIWDYERDCWFMPVKVIEEMNGILKQYGVDA